MNNRRAMKCVTLMAVGMLTAVAQADESGAAIPQMVTETVVVTATRLTQAPFDQPYAYYRVTMDELDGRIGRTALDRMNYGPGVFVQRTAPNQASPFIRGLTGEQTLLMFDGIRLSHAFMRPGPNQYAALVPDLGLSTVDVILGSSSTVNGSDGLTGGLDFRLAPAGRGVSRGHSVWARSRLDSGNGSTLETGMDGAAGGWAYTAELGGSAFHDRVGGRDFRDHLFGADLDDDRIPNTAYDQYSAGVRLSYAGFDNHLLSFSAGHKRQEDAPRPDGYFENTGRSDRIYRYFDPQAFTYVHLKDTWKIGGRMLERLDTKLWWHQHTEEQFRSSLRDGGTPDERIRRREYDNDLDAFGIDLQATTLLGRAGAHALTWGATYIAERTGNAYREFRTPAGVTDLSLLAPHNPQNWSNSTTVSDNSDYTRMGLFVQDDWRISQRFSVLLGIRYSDYQWSFGSVDGDTDDFSGSARLLWRVNETHRLFAGVSRGFRAPNLTNLDGLVDRGSSGNPATGNPDLEPEVSSSIEAGWKWRSGLNQFQLTLFRTFIDDLIQPDFARSPAVTTNVEGADLYGFESVWAFGVSIGADQRLALVGSASLLDATRDIPLAGGGTFEDNISRANRFYGHIGVEYERGPNWSGLLQLRWHDAYDDVARHPSDADADDVRLTVAGDADGSMPGYAVADLLVGWASSNGNYRARFFIENLAGRTYREPGSGVDGVGRNFGVTASMRF